MSSVYSRAIRSTPYRDALDTWNVIVGLLTQGRRGEATAELKAVSGIVSSLISDQAPKEAPIVVSCEGPRTRIYCLYDESAIEEDQSNEESLGFDPLNGKWTISLPSPKSDLEWVQAALKKHSSRITARDQSEGFAVEEAASSGAKSLTLDLEAFLKP